MKHTMNKHIYNNMGGRLRHDACATRLGAANSTMRCSGGGGSRPGRPSPVASSGPRLWVSGLAAQQSRATWWHVAAIHPVPVCAMCLWRSAAIWKAASMLSTPVITVALDLAADQPHASTSPHVPRVPASCLPVAPDAACVVTVLAVSAPQRGRQRRAPGAAAALAAAGGPGPVPRPARRLAVTGGRPADAVRAAPVAGARPWCTVAVPSIRNALASAADDFAAGHIAQYMAVVLSWHRPAHTWRWLPCLRHDSTG